MLQISEANRMVTVKENCHSGLFDRSSDVEAAVALIRAVQSLEMGTVACVSQVGPMWSWASLQEGGRKPSRDRVCTMEARDHRGGREE